MAKRRFIAPWHRQSLDSGVRDSSVRDSMSARSVAVLDALRGKAAIYHCMSRIVGRAFVLGREEREQFVRLMRRYARFSQVKVWTYCVMSNHFHILLEVPAPPADRGASWSDERLLEHLSLIYGKPKMGELRWELGHYRAQGNDAAAAAFREKFFARMWNLSEYMKIVKQCFTQWFNRNHGRRGVLWEERFRSGLVEDGRAARRVAAYIDLNAVRAGIVSDPKHYRWSGYGAATGGETVAREGLRLVMSGAAAPRADGWHGVGERSHWREVARRYRMVLYATGEHGERDLEKKRAGIRARRVAEVIREGGRLSEADLCWCRTRYFVDGVAIGLKDFVEMNYEATRGYFGALRRSGARRMRRIRTALCTLRDLQAGALRGSSGDG